MDMTLARKARRGEAPMFSIGGPCPPGRVPRGVVRNLSGWLEEVLAVGCERPAVSAKRARRDAKAVVSVARVSVGSAGYGRAMPQKYKEVRVALIDAGWAVIRQRGSHEVWAHSDREQRIVVAGKDSATVPVGTLGSIRQASGLEDLR